MNKTEQTRTIRQEKKTIPPVPDQNDPIVVTCLYKRHPQHASFKQYQNELNKAKVEYRQTWHDLSGDERDANVLDIVRRLQQGRNDENQIKIYSYQRVEGRSDKQWKVMTNIELAAWIRTSLDSQLDIPPIDDQDNPIVLTCLHKGHPQHVASTELQKELESAKEQYQGTWLKHHNGTLIKSPIDERNTAARKIVEKLQQGRHDENQRKAYSYQSKVDGLPEKEWRVYTNSELRKKIRISLDTHFNRKDSNQLRNNTAAHFEGTNEDERGYYSDATNNNTNDEEEADARSHSSNSVVNDDDDAHHACSNAAGIENELTDFEIEAVLQDSENEEICIDSRLQREHQQMFSPDSIPIEYRHPNSHYIPNNSNDQIRNTGQGIEDELTTSDHDVDITNEHSEKAAFAIPINDSHINSPCIRSNGNNRIRSASQDTTAKKRKLVCNSDSGTSVTTDPSRSESQSIKGNHSSQGKYDIQFLHVVSGSSCINHATVNFGRGWKPRVDSDSSLCGLDAMCKSIHGQVGLPGSHFEKYFIKITICDKMFQSEAWVAISCWHDDGTAATFCGKNSCPDIVWCLATAYVDAVNKSNHGESPGESDYNEGEENFDTKLAAPIPEMYSINILQVSYTNSKVTATVQLKSESWIGGMKPPLSLSGDNTIALLLKTINECIGGQEVTFIECCSRQTTAFNNEQQNIETIIRVSYDNIPYSGYATANDTITSIAKAYVSSINNVLYAMRR